jgi:hypothetical protein
VAARPAPKSSPDKDDLGHAQVAAAPNGEAEVVLDPEDVYRECADRARGVCGKGAVTRHYRMAAYAFCVLWCTTCAVLVLAYGVQFGHRTVEWLGMWGEAILMDVFFIKPGVIVAGVLIDELLVLERMHHDDGMDLDMEMDDNEADIDDD